VTQSKEGVTISQRKYALDILEEIGLKNCKPIDSPMDSNQKLMKDQGDHFPDLKRYRRLVGKFIYLTITRSDLSYPMGVVSQFMQNPHIDNWNAVIHILIYVKGNLRQGLLYENKGSTQIEGYCDAYWVGSPIDKRSTTCTVYSLEGTLYLEKIRNKVLLLDLMQKLNIDLWLLLHLKL